MGQLSPAAFCSFALFCISIPYRRPASSIGYQAHQLHQASLPWAAAQQGEHTLLHLLALLRVWVAPISRASHMVLYHAQTHISDSCRR